MKLIGLVLLVVMLLISCGNNQADIGGSGLIEATEVVISAKTFGQLIRLNFDEGDHVLQNDTLGLIDTSTTVLQLRQAEALVEAAGVKLRIGDKEIEQAAQNLALAQMEFDRIASLIGSGSANQQQYDQAQTALTQARLIKEKADLAYQAAQAELKSARSQAAILKKQVEDSFPLAPIEGTIVTKFIEPGELVIMGRPLVKIANLETVWVKIYLSPADLTRINLGDPAKVDPESGGKNILSGTITWISDQAEFTPKNVQSKEARADLVYAVKITIPNPGHVLKIGMPVSVKIQ